MLGQSDLVSIHALLTPETRHIIDARRLRLLPDGAILVNTSRGALLEFGALHDALRDGSLAGAALDVFEEEPLDRADPLIAAWAAGQAWLDDKLILTPHAAFYSRSSLADIRRLSMSYLALYLRTGRARTCVNAHLLQAAGHGMAE